MYVRQLQGEMWYDRVDTTAPNPPSRTQPRGSHKYHTLCPPTAAAMTAVMPSVLRLFTSELLAMRSAATAFLPSPAASHSAVTPVVVFASTSAPSCRGSKNAAKGDKRRPCLYWLQIIWIAHGVQDIHRFCMISYTSARTEAETSNRSSTVRHPLQSTSKTVVVPFARLKEQSLVPETSQTLHH